VCTQVGATGLKIDNGWLVFEDRAIFGFSQYSEIWKPKRRPNITKNTPGEFGPNKTEDLDNLTDAMLSYGYPVFEHHHGLWYDRRRNLHTKDCKKTDKVVSPFFEMPWARSGEGIACDGLSRYDLTRFNPWYFQRLSEFAGLSDRKGTILVHNYYQQHNLLEHQTHYIDFPWRPNNTIQDTGMPDYHPAANKFYDVSHATRRELHSLYIERVLDEIGDYENVIHFTAAEYTGSLAFVRFWMDTIIAWEDKNNKDVKIGIAAPKNVLDGILQDPQRVKHVDAIDLRYFWYRRDGSLAAIDGGQHIAGSRYFDGEKLSERSSPDMLYRQVLEYRQAYPDKAIFHAVGYDRRFMLVLLMAGGSVNSAKLHYRDGAYPEHYEAPLETLAWQPVFEFYRDRLAHLLPGMKPDRAIVAGFGSAFALSGPDAILVYTLADDKLALELSGFPGQYIATWFNPESGKIAKLESPVSGGEVVNIESPFNNDSLLLLDRLP
jgi:hypothetical protein